MAEKGKKERLLCKTKLRDYETNREEEKKAVVLFPLLQV